MNVTMQVDQFHKNFEAEVADDTESDDAEDVSSKAPDLDKLWPPFGLFGSVKAAEVLGEECRAIQDSIGPFATYPTTEVRDSNVVNVAAAAANIDGTHSATSGYSTLRGCGTCNISCRNTSDSATRGRHTNCDPDSTERTMQSTSTVANVSAKVCVRVGLSSTSFPVSTLRPKELDAVPVFTIRESTSGKSVIQAGGSNNLPKVQAPTSTTFVRHHINVTSGDASLTTHRPNFAGTCDVIASNNLTIRACPSVFQDFQDIGVLASESAHPVVGDSMDTSS